MFGTNRKLLSLRCAFWDFENIQLQGFAPWDFKVSILVLWSCILSSQSNDYIIKIKIIVAPCRAENGATARNKCNSKILIPICEQLTAKT